MYRKSKHILFSNTFFKCAVRETTWKNAIEPEKQLMAMQYGAKMEFAYLMTRGNMQYHCINI
jgi:hypothetical protein